MIKIKRNYEVTTNAKCLTDVATGDAGAEAYRTFMGSDIEHSNDYYIRKDKICSVVVKAANEQVEVEDNTCVPSEPPVPPTPKPYIEGADNVSVKQGIGIDLTDGVKAYDGEGSEIPFTVEPTEIDKCDVGTHDVTYSFGGETKVRKVTITQIANPTISGATEPISVEINEEFDPLDGVSAVDGNGNEVEVTVEQ